MIRSARSWHTYFFEDKPLFGMDIGHDELRVMQIDVRYKIPRLKGYGSTSFDPRAIVDNVIVRPDLIAQSAVKLFTKELVGNISTKRVAISLPANRAFTRAVQLPKMNPKDIEEAVIGEVDQYIPVHSEDLYLDYTTIRDDGETIEVLVVAMPKKIVDSYVALSTMLGLEVVLFDTVIGASAHLFAHDRQSDVPSVLVDFGAENTDITVFNKVMLATGTAAFGGDHLTATIARALRVTPSEAMLLKTKYGLSKSVFQKQITAAVEPSLELLLKEIRRTIRYYEQRYTKEPTIGQVVTMGGGANMPGLVDFLTDHLRLPARTFDPAAHIDFSHLRSFYKADHMAYVTTAGLAITDPKEIFA